MADGLLEPRNRPASTKRNIGRAIFYSLMTIIFFWIFIALEGMYPTPESGVSLQQLPTIAAGSVAIYCLLLAWRHFKRRYIGLPDGALKRGAPVLYLRPFKQDGGWDGSAPFTLYIPRTWPKLFKFPDNFVALYLQLTLRASFEQVLAFVVRKIGPMVAIGEPGSAPILGAYNIYVGDDRWQEQVRDLGRQAKLVILTAGTSEGVMWEVENMTKLVAPEHLLLNVPGKSRRRRRKTYDKFRPAGEPFFPAGLPETLNGSRFVCFEDDWTPRAGRIRRPEKYSTRWVAKKISALVM